MLAITTTATKTGRLLRNLPGPYLPTSCDRYAAAFFLGRTPIMLLRALPIALALLAICSLERPAAGQTDKVDTLDCLQGKVDCSQEPPEPMRPSKPLPSSTKP